MPHGNGALRTPRFDSYLNPMHQLTLGLLALELAVSYPGAHDRATWWLEVFPVILALPLVWHFGRQGRLSPFLQAVIVVHGLVLCVGAHYTYALAPPGEWVRDLGIGARNNYDKLGHLMQGITPAFALREILMRLGRWTPRAFMGTVTVLACGGISALYEVLEMTAALILGGGADAFLGTQGYVWDTQTDMATAMAGAVVAVLILAKTQQRSIGKMKPER
jgi:putative membrane protein